MPSQPQAPWNADIDAKASLDIGDSSCFATHAAILSSPCIETPEIAHISAMRPCRDILTAQYWTRPCKPLSSRFKCPQKDQPHLCKLQSDLLMVGYTPLGNSSFPLNYKFKQLLRASLFSVTSDTGRSGPHDVRLHLCYTPVGTCLTAGGFVARLSARYMDKSSSVLHNQC